MAERELSFVEVLLFSAPKSLNVFLWRVAGTNLDFFTYTVICRVSKYRRLTAYITKDVGKG